MRLAALTAVAVVALAALVATPARPQDPRCVAVNMSREQIRSLPIVERPNRPIHFYGNAVRRRHHRATGR